MSEPSPFFYAWCDAADRVEAFAATLSALVCPGGTFDFMLSGGIRGPLSLDDVIKGMRADFAPNKCVYVFFDVVVSSGRVLGFSGYCFGAELEGSGASGPLNLHPISRRIDLLPAELSIALGGGGRSVEVEATIAAILAQPDVEDLLLRFCAPDASAPARVPTGGCSELGGWGAPIEIGATYHAREAEVARDLALSFVHLHDKDRVDVAAGMSLDALHARVDAAPHGTRVPIKGFGELSREAVLQALATPPAALLDALEAAAASPDDEWRAVEPLAREAMEATEAGAPTYEADLTTRKHHRFLEQHAPYHVRRLPNGGVMLATYPYRKLWPLWADALWLLGISP